MRRIWNPGVQEWFGRILIFSWVPGFLIFSASASEQVQIGSKKFTESYVLSEIAKRTLTEAGIAAEHRQGMGGTIILWEALRGGQIGVYPEYTGTITQEILKRTDELTFEQIANELGKAGIGMTEPLGFNNTYALVMRRVRASELGIRTITDLQNHPELKFGLTHEFLDRQDGWRPLAQHYQLNPQNVIGIDHALGYGALGKGSVDVKDAYSTDAKISENDLVVLEDDRQFFPQYKAVFLFRYALPTPAIEALRKLEGTIEEAKMTRLNAEAERTKNYTRAANLYFEDSSGSTRLRQGYGVASNTFGETFPHKLARWTARHLELAAFSLLLSVLVGIPLGIFASRGGAIGHAILGFAGIVQTIPSLALLRCLCRCHFLESASGPRSRRFFSTVSCRLFAIPRPVYRTFHGHYASRRSRSD